jgi:geranylgeranyl pyrophosphate synthase
MNQLADSALAKLAELEIDEHSRAALNLLARKVVDRDS